MMNFRNFILSLSTLCLPACADVTCDGSDPEVAMARSLSQQRLAQLHSDAMQFATGDHWNGEIPLEFNDLKPVALRSHFEGVVSIRLRGCMDHHIDLVAFDKGTSFKPGKARVELWFGEIPRTEEVLWHQSDRDPTNR